MTVLARIGRVFPRSTIIGTVQTTTHFQATPKEVWEGMMFYEEIPQRPPTLLRTLLPMPVRTQGEKTRVGALIECTYHGGYLEKRITTVDAARSVTFDVLLQRLGIEDCITMTGGSYEMHETESGTDVVLTTRYCGHLRPRFVWRPFERYLAHRVHRHILDGMRLVLEGASESLVLART